MNDFLNSVKADLGDRRLRPFVIVVALALAGAVAYGVLGGGSSSSTHVAVVATPSPAGASITAIEATPKNAVSETTEGEAEQHHGPAHNPFDALAVPKPVKATPAASSASASKTSSSTTSSSSTATGEATPTTEPVPTTPAKQHTVYHVAVLFGLASPPPPAPATALTPYEHLKLLTPLPSAKTPLVVFRGVTSGGKSATFTIVSEAILHGPGACLPSATQCQAIDVKPGQTEQLEYLGAEGQVTTYELTVASIAASKASSASVKSLLGGSSKAGRKVLSDAGLLAIPDLRASSQAGVLVFAGHSAFAARAHSAQRHDHRR
jgi:hypothetical protein